MQPKYRFGDKVRVNEWKNVGIVTRAQYEESTNSWFYDVVFEGVLVWPCAEIDMILVEATHD